MATLKKGYKNPAFRLLLVAGYLVLFATQFSDRYYATANFFDYGNKAAKAASAAGRQRITPVQHTSHLSIDKRFRFRNAIKPVFISAVPGLPSFTLVKKKASPPSSAYISSDLLTNALRGPPCA